METTNSIMIEYEIVNEVPEIRSLPPRAGRMSKKKRITLVLVIELLLLSAVTLPLVKSMVTANIEKKEYFERIAETQGDLYYSNAEAALNLQEQVINDEGAWYDEYHERWCRGVTLYTTDDVDESFITDAFGFYSDYDFDQNYELTRESYLSFGEASGMTDYYTWGFAEDYTYSEYELYEDSGIKEWNVMVYSDVSPEEQQLIDDTAKKIADKATGSDAEKIRTITNEIDDMLTYELIDGNDLSEVISTGKGCCRHYADLFFLACTYAGIDSRIVAGTCNDGGLHAWNIAKVGGKWYHVDPTWEDDDSGNWVLLGSETIKETREIHPAYEDIDKLYDISEDDYAA